CESTLAAAPGRSSVVAGRLLLVLDRALMYGSPLSTQFDLIRTFRLTPLLTNEGRSSVPDRGAVGCEVGNKLSGSGANHFHGSIDRCGRVQRIIAPRSGAEDTEPRPHGRGPWRRRCAWPAHHRHVSARTAQDRR